MDINYNYDELVASGPTYSYQNVSNKTFSFIVDTVQFKVEPMDIVTLPIDADNNQFIAAAVADGYLIKLKVYGFRPTKGTLAVAAAADQAALANSSFVSGDQGPAVIGVAPTQSPQTTTPSSTTSPIVASSTVLAASKSTAVAPSSGVGGFAGITLDTDGYWVLANGNQVIYPLNKTFHQPSPGINSIVVCSATMRRTDATLGNLGFAIYTDSTTGELNFRNGYLLYWDNDGTGSVHKVNAGAQLPLATTQENQYVLDSHFHDFSAVVYQTAPGQLEFFLYADGNLVSQSVDLEDGYIGGAVGFSTSQGTLPVYVVPNSFSFQHGPLELAALPTVVNPILNPTGLSGTNLIPDSGFIFGDTYWDFAFSGGMTVVPAVGADGGNGVVYLAGATTPGPVFFNTNDVIAIPLLSGKQYCLSMNIDATNVTSGNPTLELRDNVGSVVLASVQQTHGVNGIVSVTYTTPSSQDVTVFGNMESATVSSGGRVIFSVPQLQIGNQRTQYVQTSITNNVALPYTTTSTSVQGVINSSSNVLTQMFGSTSGVSVDLQGALIGFTNAGISTAHSLPSATAIVVYADVSLHDATDAINIVIGNRSTNGFGITINGTSEFAKLIQYGGSGAGTLATNPGSFTVVADRFYRLRIAVDFAQTMVEAAVDDVGTIGGVALLYTPIPLSGAFPPFANSIPLTIYNTLGTAKIHNLQINPRELFLSQSLAYQNAIVPTISTSGVLTNGIQLDSNTGPSIRTGTSATPSIGAWARGDVYVRTGGAAGTTHTFATFDGTTLQWLY